jgi:MYXO-CTERM domain-containing protein
MHTVTVVGTAAAGTSSGTLTVTTDVVASRTTTVQLSINGTQTGVVANPSTADFGPLMVGVASSPMTISVINCSSKSLSVMGYAVSGTDGAAFQATGPSSASIPIGGNETWSVVFTPQHAGQHTAQLELHNDSATDPLIAMLTGSGTTTSTGGDGGIDGGGNAEKSTSYYACACRSSSPAGGAPILLALVLVLRRRRQR